MPARERKEQRYPQQQPPRRAERSRRMERMESTVALIQQRWGNQAIRKASEIPAPMAPVCSSGFAALDHALGGGGFPQGRHSELIGYGTAGQFSVAAGALAQAQRQGEQVAYVDIYASLDVDALVRCGVRLDALVVLRPRDWSHALAMTTDLLRAGGVGAVVLDRLNDLHLLADGEACRGLDRALRDWTPILARSLCAMLFITETAAPGFYEGSPGFGPTRNPLAFFASVRLLFERQSWLQRGRQVVGYTSRVTVLKNKLGPSGQAVTLSIPVA